MKIVGFVALALASTAMLGSASAQSLTDVKGNVLVNQGSGYVKAASGAGLAPGDAVMARPGGSSVVRYADGCRVRVLPGKVVRVAAVSPCSGNVADLGEPAPPPPEVVPGGFPVLAVGGLVVLGGIGVIIAASISASP